MKEPGVKDTTAYKIVRQITDHVYGPDTKISNEDFIHIFYDFGIHGGSWERLMNGDMGCVKIIEESIDDFVKNSKVASIAARVAQIKYR